MTSDEDEVLMSDEESLLQVEGQIYQQPVIMNSSKFGRKGAAAKWKKDRRVSFRANINLKNYKNVVADSECSSEVSFYPKQLQKKAPRS